MRSQCTQRRPGNVEASHSGFLGSNRSRLIAALAFVTGLLIAAVIILIVSRTTFTAQTTTEPNTWSTGTAVLTNDHGPGRTRSPPPGSAA